MAQDARSGAGQGRVHDVAFTPLEPANIRVCAPLAVAVSGSVLRSDPPSDAGEVAEQRSRANPDWGKGRTVPVCS